MQISTDASRWFRTARRATSRNHQAPVRAVASASSLLSSVSDTTDVQQLVGIGDAASGWVGETTSRAQTNAPELAQRTATFGEIYARPRIYQHMLEDASSTLLVT